jgi:hypothetical protein
MPNNHLYDFFRQLDEDGVMLSYKGLISSELIASLLKIVEDKLEKTEQSTVLRKKVYHILVESLQNLYHHGDANPDSMDAVSKISQSAVVSVIKEQNTYYIQTGNFIKNEPLITLLQKINALNELNADELKSLYQQRLNSAVISEKGTPGLGLIDMLRKSGNKIEYSVTKINSIYSFLCIQIKINN